MELKQDATAVFRDVAHQTTLSGGDVAAKLVLAQSLMNIAAAIHRGAEVLAGAIANRPQPPTLEPPAKFDF